MLWALGPKISSVCNSLPLVPLERKPQIYSSLHRERHLESLKWEACSTCEVLPCDLEHCTIRVLDCIIGLCMLVYIPLRDSDVMQGDGVALFFPLCKFQTPGILKMGMTMNMSNKQWCLESQVKMWRLGYSVLNWGEWKRADCEAIGFEWEESGHLLHPIDSSTSHIS